jgi:DNA ligase (NAD+)
MLGVQVYSPDAVLEPVEIGGVIVRQATLHNFDYVADKDIRIGDRVAVKRAGDVIPYVIGPMVAARTGDEQVYTPPQYCPTCGQPTEHLEGRYLIAQRSLPPVNRNWSILSKGDGHRRMIRIVEQVVAAGFVKDVADLYSLKREDLLSLEGFADKKADNLLESIEISRNRPLPRLITALGIRGVGEVVAADLARAFQDLDRLSNATLEELQSLEGIGPNIAQAIVDWFARPANQQVLQKLRLAGVWPRMELESAEPAGGKPLEDMTFVVTGSLANFTRQSIKEYIEAHGGKVTDSVSKNTTYLVQGENPGSKLDKARSLGVTIIDEDGLRRLVGAN